MTRFFIFLTVFIFTLSTSAQKEERLKSKFGQPTTDEFQMKDYSLDPEAAAVVLFEQGKHTIKVIGNKIRVIKSYYQKVKVLDAKNFDEAEIEISLYTSDRGSEKLTHLEALTINGLDRSRVAKEQIYFADSGKNIREAKFAFPKVIDGSILEYRYVIESPYFFDLGDWSFQGSLPKIYSEFNSEIPGNYQYRKSLIGTKNLDIDESYVNIDCFNVPGYEEPGDCNGALYAMFDVPSFQEEEYMLASKNYTSGLNYELTRYIGFDGQEQDFSKEWKDVDREFKKDKNLGKQWNYSKYFKNELPQNILSINDEMEKAKAIYKFVQDHYTWNRSHRLFSEARVKEAYKEKTGGATEINLTLLNCFKAADLESYLVLLSTRDNGIVTKLHPILTEFNYAVAAVDIGGTIYLLDATDDLIPFGMMPFRTLNGEGRKFDFENESSWLSISPYKNNFNALNAELSIGSEGFVSGKVSETHAGYNALEQRKELANNSRDTYIQQKAARSTETEITNYELSNLEKIEENLIEQFEIEAPIEEIGDQLFFDAFSLKKFFSTNPFKLEERNYPVNFGYPRKATYISSVKVDPSLKVVFVPENKSFQLGNSAVINAYYEYKENQIRVNISLRINRYHYKAEEYEALKTFFAEIIEVQENSKFVLEKI